MRASTCLAAIFSLLCSEHASGSGVNGAWANVVQRNPFNKRAVAARQDGEFSSTVFSQPAGTGPPAGTATSSSPSSTPFLFFDTIPSMMSCTQGVVTWVYAGPSTPMMIMITNIDVDQSSPSPTPTSASATRSRNTDDVGVNGLGDRGIPTGVYPTDSTATPVPSGFPPIVETLSTTVDPWGFNFTWSSVNVPQGWYKLQANISSTLFNSDEFFVSNGTDTSCLITVNPSTNPTSAPAPTGSGGGTLPVNTGASRVNKGAIAGGVVGGLAIVAAVLAAYLCLRCSKQPARRGKGSTLGGIVGRWGSLGSFDSTAKTQPRSNKAKLYNGGRVAGMTGLGLGVAGSQGRRSSHSQRHHSQAESLGPVLPASELASRASRGTTDEDMGGYHSPYEEKYHRSPFSDQSQSHDSHDGMGVIPIGYAPTPNTSSAATAGHPTSKHSSTTSSVLSYAQNNNYSRPRSHSQRNFAPSPQTVPDSPTVSSGFDSKRGSSSAPTPAYPSGVSGVLPDPSPPSRNQPSPLVLAGQSSSANPQTPSRKTPRKPVPTYSPDPTLAFALADQPMDVGEDESFQGHPHTLVHKDSSGSVKQMHYLIPDLPPPQKD